MKSNYMFLDMLNSYLNSYITEERGLSINTRKTYADAFKLLFDYFYDEHGLKSDELEFKDLNYDNITGYLKWLENVRGCSGSSRNQRLAALKSFSDYAQIHSIEASLAFRRDMLKIRRKKYNSKDKSYFLKEEVKALFEACPDTPIGKRNKVLLAFMYSSGARAQEVCDIQVKDIQFLDSRTYITLRGKGKKSRQISIPEKTALLLGQYMVFREIHEKPEVYVFPSQTHNHMTISCIEEIYKKVIADAKESHPDLFRSTYSPHSMRHTTATHMVEAGIPLMVIKNFMGHSSVQTTQIYAKITQEYLDIQTQNWNQIWLSGLCKTEKKNARSDNIPDFLR